MTTDSTVKPLSLNTLKAIAGKLGSDHDNEVLSAAHLLRKMLEPHKLRIEDLIALPHGTPAAQPSRPQPQQQRPADTAQAEAARRQREAAEAFTRAAGMYGGGPGREQWFDMDALTEALNRFRRAGGFGGGFGGFDDGWKPEYREPPHAKPDPPDPAMDGIDWRETLVKLSQAMQAAHCREDDLDFVLAKARECGGRTRGVPGMERLWTPTRGDAERIMRMANQYGSTVVRRHYAQDRAEPQPKGPKTHDHATLNWDVLVGDLNLIAKAGQMDYSDSTFVSLMAKEREMFYASPDVGATRWRPTRMTGARLIALGRKHAIID